MRPRHYVCDNPNCEYKGWEREVQPVQLPGGGLYAWPGDVVCECRPDIALRRVVLKRPPVDRAWVAWDSVSADIAADVTAAMKLVEDNPR